MKFPTVPVLLTVVCAFPFLAAPVTGAEITGAESGAGAWQLPLKGVPPSSILSEFAPPKSQHGAGHRGVDFPASHGDKVVSVGDGIVLFAGIIAGKPVVSIELSDSFRAFGKSVRATYEPVVATVKMGDIVSAGEPIGQISFTRTNSGHCYNSCLHFGLKTSPKSLNQYLSPRTLWKTAAQLLPSAWPTNSDRYRSPILDGQSQKSSLTVRR